MTAMLMTGRGQTRARYPDEEGFAERDGVRVFPVLVVHGTEDAQSEAWRGEELARLLGGELVLLEGAGHAPTPATR